MTSPAGIEAAFRGRLGTFALDVAFTTPGRGVTVLFGPSGCGKTTTLRCVAGLQRLEGRCIVGGGAWQDDRIFLPTHRRPIGYVFQEASLFPHMTVRKNLLYATAGRPVASEAVGFDEAVDLLGLSALLDRAPARLSGGERQRVAIGRALLAQPRLLLMDEPLSALDRPTQEEIMPFLERLHAALSLPVLLVTHDLAMVERLADHLLLIEAGRITASGPLQQIQSDPALPLALRRDAAVSLDATVTGTDAAYGLMTLAVAGGMFRVPAAELRPVGTKLRIRIAAGDVSLTRHLPEATTILNIQPARIVAATVSGVHQMTVVLALGPDGGGARILARVTRFSWERLQLAEGAAVHVQVKSVALARMD